MHVCMYMHVYKYVVKLTHNTVTDKPTGNKRYGVDFL
jgi:hypothetical protein